VEWDARSEYVVTLAQAMEHPSWSVPTMVSADWYDVCAWRVALAEAVESRRRDAEAVERHRQKAEEATRR
jgi:hypothetical protein